MRWRAVKWKLTILIQVVDATEVSLMKPKNCSHLVLEQFRTSQIFLLPVPHLHLPSTQGFSGEVPLLGNAFRTPTARLVRSDRKYIYKIVWPLSVSLLFHTVRSPWGGLSPVLGNGSDVWAAKLVVEPLPENTTPLQWVLPRLAERGTFDI